MKVLKADEMSLADYKTINETGINSLVLMENAGRTAYQIIIEKLRNYENFVIVAGSGNNGGDGLVIARYLLRANKDVKVFILARGIEKLSDDNRANLNIFRNLGGTFKFITGENKDILEKSLKNADVVIDSIFGTGFKPPIKGYRAEIIEIINKYKKFVVSIDIPSGLSTDTGELFEPHIKADITITFAYPKLAHILYPSSLSCGDIYVVDISIDEKYVKDIHREILTFKNIKLPKRKKNSHKYTYGHTLIIGGSIGKTGAVIMASKSASAIGSGLTTAVIPRSLNNILESSLTEEMTIPVDDEDGYFGENSLKEVKDIVDNGKFTSIGVGMGMSVNENSINLVKGILSIELPIVIDADGLNCLSQIDNFEDLILKRNAPTVLTPHIGEMSRLTGLKNSEILKNMEEVAKEFSKKTGSYTVLKASRTVISTPEGKIYYSIRGNEGLATAGTGDILAGILSSLVYRLGAEEGCKTGVFIHGFLGELAVKDSHVESLKATDLIKYIPKAYGIISEEQNKEDYNVLFPF